ncbi:MAG: 50S ribosomal protein L4 [Gammaproteobacteria bacterium RIFCSPLOWO2_02_FULL_42_14]|nr:MAG: 50S ribosomal protein L4 [Gammaproteobacteria bacterium RIFCSPHIGHO2_02_FULL_42_43]OGT28752.1 MAG: 50S ribosomal protein L4 [Gammaproteobacteria bacterium RIFCSPHIGHO2_01_FULL_42_8]OGT52183.1 MAG: 50S ribosomal protein L4 [Gammaproteobacteria bacterium RIFCSPHIGHO2_12_FULL_41_25]OGT62621.1 MAG: 50S ribosomal protein L4 [Gammaproteobacteria bacterium RIFCSPLOWO2_02_FULL_42_14]OGT86603.1 MAG: 50S ribosomal protein L4 [Gammaproteobacteria bacterium RIFCSPLOWO2_12_FULL_42_18]
MKITVQGGASVNVSDDIFACEYNEGLVHQVVTAHLSGARQGTKAQKTRAEVRGGGAKPWKQKGTGRARAGTSRGPLWRGGGVTFAAKPRSFSQKINKKMYRKGVRVILSELLRQDRLMLTKEIQLKAPKTKELVSYLGELKIDNVLIILDGDNQNLQLAARNLPNVAVCHSEEVDPVNLLSFEKILFTVPALQKLETRLAGAH